MHENSIVFPTSNPNDTTKTYRCSSHEILFMTLFTVNKRKKNKIKILHNNRAEILGNKQSNCIGYK